MNTLTLLRRFLDLRGNAAKSRAAMAEMQEQKLRQLLAYAYGHSAYHRRRFQAAGISEELLPVLPLAAFPTMDASRR